MEPEIKVAVLKATAKCKCTQQCHNELYVHKWHGNLNFIQTQEILTENSQGKKK